MKYCLRLKYTFLLIGLIFSNAFSQNIDSLKLSLKNAKHDTTRAKLLVEISEVCDFKDINDFANKALSICSQNLKNRSITSKDHFLFFKYASNALNNKGFISDQVGITDKAILYYELALKIQEFINDKKAMAYTLNNIAFTLDNGGDIPKSLDYMHKALKLQESIKDKTGEAISLINIGNSFRANGEQLKAIDFFNKGLKIHEELNNKSQIAVALLNIGDVYFTKGDNVNSLKYFNRAIALCEDDDNEYVLSYALVNLGHIYQKQNSYTKALELFKKSLSMFENQGDKAGETKALINVVEVLLKQDNLNEALEFAKKSLKLSQEFGYPIQIKATSELLSEIYATQGYYDKAYEMHCLFKLMADSVNRQENKKASIQKSFQYEFDKKETEAKAEQDKKDTIALKEKQKQTIITYAIALGLLIALSFGIFIFRSYRQKQKANVIITQQKLVVEKQKEEVEHQKHIIEEAQKEISDSINYAKRIQSSFMASKQELDARLNNYFVLFKPKDVVSGDFYWANYSNNYFYLCTADSTGHGIPGAFMSLLNISLLNEGLFSRNLTNTADILNFVRKILILGVKADESGQGGKDGMDCSLMRFDFENNILSYSAANNPIWIVRNFDSAQLPNNDSAQLKNNSYELIELKPDKMPVGKHDKQDVPFTQHDIQLQKGDVIYTLTDGFPDQFGGPKGKKFMSKNLRELLQANSHLPMNQQKELLENTFTKWVGELEQIDDVTLIGIKV